MIVEQPVPGRQHQRDGDDGERRVRASVLAGVDRIPAVCREVSDEDMLKLGLIENIQREDLNPIETARAYRADWQAFAAWCALVPAPTTKTLASSSVAEVAILPTSEPSGKFCSSLGISMPSGGRL